MAKSKTKPKRAMQQKQIEPEAKLKRGQPRKIASPARLKEYFNEYKEWVKITPYLVHDFVGKDAEEVRRERQRPLTWIGFEGWLAMKEIITDLKRYEENTDGRFDDYVPIIRACKVQTTMDIVDGALGQIYNANLAARIIGLKDSQDINVNDNRKAAGNLFPEELKEE